MGCWRGGMWLVVNMVACRGILWLADIFCGVSTMIVGVSLEFNRGKYELGESPETHPRSTRIS